MNPEHKTVGAFMEGYRLGRQAAEQIYKQDKELTKNDERKEADDAGAETSENR